MRLLLALFLALAAPAPAHTDVWADWNAAEKDVRDNRVPPAKSRERLTALHRQLVATAPRAMAGTARHFPVRGHGLRDVGGKGKGFVASGYNFYDGTRHGGHPAHDIFIRDTDRDCRDDRTGKPVEVVSFTGGVVVAVETSWAPGGPTRGGIYAWVWEPVEDAFYAYAHLARVDVKPGEPVEPGQVIGTVGRTGRNAWPARSPTHLHFTRLDWDGGRMTPRDTWPALQKSVR